MAVSAPLPVIVPLPSLAVSCGHLWRVTPGGVVITELGGGAERRLDGAVDALVGMHDEVWAITGSALVRHRTDGTSAAVPITPDIGRGASVTACRTGSAAVVVQGAGAARLDAHSATPLPASRDVIVPMPAGEIVRSGHRVVRRRERVETPLPLPNDLVMASTLVGGAAMAGGAVVAVEMRGPSGTHVLVVDLERPGPITRLRMTGVSRILWIEERVHAVVVRGRALTVIDLRHGRHVATHTADAPVLDAAIDADASSLVAVTAGGLEVFDYRRLTGVPPARVATAESLSAPAEPAEATEPAEPAEPAEVAAVPPPLVVPPPTAPAPALAEPALGAAPLLALFPRDELPPLDDNDLRAHLEACFAIVAAWCDIAARSDAGDPEAVAAARARERVAAERLERWRGTPTPLAAVTDELGLSPLACAILLVAAAPLLWGELAAVYRDLADDPQRALVDEQRLCRLLEVGRARRHDLSRELDEDAPLRRHGWIELGPGARPFAPLEVPRTVLRRLTGDRFDGPHEQPPAAACDRTLDELHAPRTAIARVLDELAASAAPGRVVVRGRSGSGRRAIAAALARRAGRTVGLIDIAPGPTTSVVEALRRDLREVHRRGWIPCVSGTDALAGSDVAVRDGIRRALDLHPGPLFVRCDPGATPPLAAGHIVLDLPTPPVAERAVAWSDALGRAGLDRAPARALAERYTIGAGRASRIAADVARAGGDADGLVERVDRALAQERAERLGRIATRVERLAGWDDLVLPDDMLDSVREMIARVRLRSTVLDDWGMERIASTARAVTALFQGGPGTGKTMVAGVIARALGYDLYRVDLSRVTSKWIGETEKNLAELFDAAEDGRCILLFDEADSLFARRTEVRSSNDRYANLEVNYLLQRLDTFEGIAILTTNFGAAIDPAFKRRLSLHLQFPFPDDSERELLWRAHLPPGLPTSGELDLAGLARTYRLSGGYIRNAALRAAYLAAAEDGPLTAGHLRRAVIAEYRDRGKVSATGSLE